MFELEKGACWLLSLRAVFALSTALKGAGFASLLNPVTALDAGLGILWRNVSLEP